MTPSTAYRKPTDNEANDIVFHLTHNIASASKDYFIVIVIKSLIKWSVRYSTNFLRYYTLFTKCFSGIRKRPVLYRLQPEAGFDIAVRDRAPQKIELISQPGFGPSNR